MSAKLVLMILVILRGCYTYDLSSDSQISSNTLVSCIVADERITIECGRKNDSYQHNMNEKIHEVTIINCSIQDGHGFDAELERCEIKGEIVTFQANKVRSLKGLFRSGFAKLENLILYRNQITEVNEDAFSQVPNLKKLDLGRNIIVRLHKYSFSKCVELNVLKLNGNRLSTLPDGIFEKQKKLEILYLNANRLESITKETFEGLDSLIVLNLELNNFKYISEDVFQNIPRLRRIQFGNSKIQIPRNIFAHHVNLTYVDLLKVNVTNGLNVTNLERLVIKSSEVMTISGLSKVKYLKINESVIRSLDENTFQNQSHMISLDLSSNNLTNLPDRLFRDLKNLKWLHLHHNSLANISENIFKYLENLTSIDLSYNCLTIIPPHAFAYSKHLKSVNLANNRFTKIPYNLMKIDNLHELNLESNEISSVKYNELRSTNIFLNSTSSLQINLDNNPLKCDCTMYEFLLEKGKVANVFNNLCLYDEHTLKICATRKLFSDIWNCPNGCECLQRKKEDGGEIKLLCAGKGLQKVPEIFSDNVTSLELDIRNNNLTELPKLRTNSQIVVIRASNNQITEIESDNLPPNLRVLDVSDNNIQRISANFLNYLKNHESLEIISLNGNPFLCRCSNDSELFIAVAKEHNSLIDLQDVKCNISNSSHPLLNGLLERHCLAKSFESTENSYLSLMQMCIVLSVLSILGGITGILCYKYKQFIKVWLYAHNACLWWVDEEYLDRHKKYDAFISYSQFDCDFAYKLIIKLENGENANRKFSLCVHERNFIPGQLIAQSIAESVENSRRTIIILSSNFIKSEWAMHEFHYAFCKSLAEKRNRLIIVKVGDIGDIDKLDDTIKSYVKTRTYIESEDKWFWDKLVYALTHRTI
ncbi:Protein toll [Pseudolycoriella hygida]|uniref:Protein toll n=1 Tax=Pseudolycoriella hygida TaxID=35572 RepID=A0A9Q0MU78_9DIPT|nr:Protein toll [Pseudolycoriella hygida]